MAQAQQAPLVMGRALTRAAAVASQPAANTRLGLHVTSDELAIWQARAASGPYKTAGDVSTNSPGDWNRIQTWADNFVSSPGTAWTGQTAASLWQWNGGVVPGAGEGESGSRSRFEKGICSALTFLLTGNTSYRDPVRTLLLSQAGQAGTNFSDTVRWRTTYDSAGAFWTTNGWQIIQWLIRLLYAYDYIRSSLSAGDQSTLDTWFSNAATFLLHYDDQNHAVIFPNRLSDNYTTKGADVAATTSSSLYFGSGTAGTGDFHSEPFSYYYEDLDIMPAVFFGLVGIMLNDSTLKARAKRVYQEWIRYAIVPDSTSVMLYKWHASPTFEVHYIFSVIGLAAQLADAFARIGDTSLYDYSSNTGLRNAANTMWLIQDGGTARQMSTILTRAANYCDGTLIRKASDSAGDTGSSFTINTNRGPTIADTFMAQANLYVNSTYVKNVYMRTQSGTLAYPAVPLGTGYSQYTGSFGVVPAVLGMFGQMEGTVDPYP